MRDGPQQSGHSGSSRENEVLPYQSDRPCSEKTLEGGYIGKNITHYLCTEPSVVMKVLIIQGSCGGKRKRHHN